MAKPPAGDLQGDARAILDALRILVREVRASSSSAERQTGLSAAQIFVLRALVREPGLGINALATRTMTHQSSVSVVVAKLVAAGLVTRQRAADDGRRATLEPTAAGRSVAGRSPDPIQERLIAGLARLPPAARARLAQDLGRWIAALGVDANAPEMFYEGGPHG